MRQYALKLDYLRTICLVSSNHKWADSHAVRVLSDRVKRRSGCTRYSCRKALRCTGPPAPPRHFRRRCGSAIPARGTRKRTWRTRKLLPIRQLYRADEPALAPLPVAPALEPYEHQLKAFRRLAGDRPTSTIVGSPPTSRCIGRGHYLHYSRSRRLRRRSSMFRLASRTVTMKICSFSSR